MKVYWATELRSFLKHLELDSDIAEFEHKNPTYDIKSKKQILMSKIIF